MIYDIIDDTTCPDFIDNGFIEFSTIEDLRPDLVHSEPDEIVKEELIRLRNVVDDIKLTLIRIQATAKREIITFMKNLADSINKILMEYARIGIPIKPFRTGASFEELAIRWLKFTDSSLLVDGEIFDFVDGISFFVTYYNETEDPIPFIARLGAPIISNLMHKTGQYAKGKKAKKLQWWFIHQFGWMRYRDQYVWEYYYGDNCIAAFRFSAIQVLETYLKMISSENDSNFLETHIELEYYYADRSCVFFEYLSSEDVIDDESKIYRETEHPDDYADWYYSDSTK